MGVRTEGGKRPVSGPPPRALCCGWFRAIRAKAAFPDRGNLRVEGSSNFIFVGDTPDSSIAASNFGTSGQEEAQVE
jgi:hypothetical protein